MSEIIFLGTGSGKLVLHDQNRGLAGILIKTDNHQIHLDPGPGIVQKAKECHVDLTKTDLFFISHNHLAQLNDINLAIDIITKGEFKNGTLITEKDSLDYITKKHRNLLEEVIVLEPNKSIEIKDLKFTGIEAKHSCNALALKLSTSDFILGYTADSAYTKELERALQGSNILIINICKPFNHSCNETMTSESVVKLISNLKPQLTILTGFGAYFNNVDPIYEARDIQKKTGQQVIAATDGLRIEPRSYSAKRNQKILSSFTEDSA